MVPTTRARGRGMRVVLLAMALALAVACLAALLGSARSAEAAFPGKNGKIAFSMLVDGDWELYKMNPDGSNQKQVTNNTSHDYGPVWSPDGQKIAFERYNKIFVKDTTNGQVVRLTDNAGKPSFEPTWSPDGTKIAFVSTRDGERDIYAMDASDGSGVLNLTDNQGAFDSWPAWSPDGSTIAFGSTRDDPNGRSDIFVMDADGSNPINLSDSYAHEITPEWSPDGTKLAFVNNSINDIMVTIKNPDGGWSHTEYVTVSPEIQEWDPAWSPDGKKIVYRESSGGFWDIWKINADGTNPTNLTNNAYAGVEEHPSWQPIPTP